MTHPGHIISETVWILDIGVKSRVLTPLDHVYQMALCWLLLGSQLTACKGHYPSRDSLLEKPDSIQKPVWWGQRIGCLTWFSWASPASVCLLPPLSSSLLSAAGTHISHIQDILEDNQNQKVV